MPLDDLQDLLQEYATLADKRDKEKLEKENAEAEKWRKDRAEQMQAYETAKAELAAVLEETVNGSYSKPLIRILKDTPAKSMDIGQVTREQQGATATHNYDHKYGIRLNNPTEGKGPIIFYAGDPHSGACDMSTLEMLNFATVRGIDDLPKLVLTAEKYAQDLTNAVAGALENLKKSAGAQ